MESDPFAGPLQKVLDLSLEHIRGLPYLPVSPRMSHQEVRAKLARSLNDDPMDATTVLEELAEDADPGLLRSTGGRFFGWVIGGALPAALAADWLTSTWDQCAGSSAASPAGGAVEEIAGSWLKEILQLPTEASFAFVTGCLMAHVTCLMAARHALLAEHGWDVERLGLSGAPRIRVVTSTNRHSTFLKAAKIVGLGTDSIISLPVDESGRLTAEELEWELTRESNPTIVLLQAGDVNTGTFDNFAELIPIAKRLEAWVHVDGAFGLWAAASRTYRHLLEGCGEADSWATDGHKWLNVPYDCGYAFVRNAAAHRASMSQLAPYVEHDDTVREQIDWNPEWSRRGRGFPTYAAIRQLGTRGIEQLIDRCCRQARDLVDGLGRLPGVEVLWRPTLNQGLVRFGDSDAVTAAVVARVRDEGRAYFTDTIWREKKAMRVSVVNWQTTDEDIERAIDAVSVAMARVNTGPSRVDE